MKKKIKIIISIILIVLIFNTIYKLLIIEHNFTYKTNNYIVKEHFYKNKNHHYDLIIKNKKENYTYTINKNLNKQKHIIKTIKKYKSNNLTCIIPIYKKEIDTNIYCNLDNIQVSNDYLIKTENIDFKKLKKKIKKYNIKLPKTNNKKTKYKKLQVYNNNIEENNIIYIWNYKGIYVLDKNKNNYKKILDYDLYDNIMSCTVDNLYVIFENTSVNGIENIYYYDYKKDKINLFKLKEKISKDSYINGVIDNYIYVTDRKNKKEYKINIRKKEIEEIDDEQTNYIVYINGKKKQLSKSDYFMHDKLFENVYIKNKKITESYELIKKGNYYYFKEDNKIYKSLDSNKNNKILLLELDDIVEWKIIEDEILILVDNKIYSYTENNGLNKIIENNELRYNYKNIYLIGKK